MIIVDFGKCTGCRCCETACAFFHTGRVNSRMSRIKVLNLYETGVDGPVACVQCRERYCLNCPDNALSLGRWGQVIVSPTVCTLCRACEKNCPVGALEIFADIVYVCDLCGGMPRCVEACTEGALTWDPSRSEQVSLMSFRKVSTGKNPGQKRDVYVRKKGEALRMKWRKGSG